MIGHSASENSWCFFVIMGVSGSGKTSIGERLASLLGCPFYDADDFHPPENVAKMSSGRPLSDEDRSPWLAALAALIQEHVESGQLAVLACSALKERYRAQLRVAPCVRFIYLNGSFDCIWDRMSSRAGHYMKPDMLRSQFEALEPPSAEEALIVDITPSIDDVMRTILATL